MLTEDKIFFQEAALRIFGSLDISKGLASCLQYLKNYIPVKLIHMVTTNPSELILKHLVIANEKNVDEKQFDSYYTKDDFILMHRIALETANKTGYIIVNKSDINDKDPASRLTANFLFQTGMDPKTANLALPLIHNQEAIGIVGFFSSPGETFTHEHARLIYMLKQPFLVALNNALQHQKVVNLQERLKNNNRYLQSELHWFIGDKVIGANQGLKETMETVNRVAHLDSAVVLLGETGTGKDLVAHTIHRLSPRHDKPFISVNCGAIPENLIDSELFGHEQGAFTGASKRKIGRFELADTGTIFLDEIGDLGLNVQSRLLRVIQYREIERVGGTKSIPVDIRVIAATNKDLKRMVKEGEFREDLWYRLSVVPISIPPLRERLEDLPDLVRHLADKKAKHLKIDPTPELDSDTIRDLERYSWPGNVRELENVIERTLIHYRQGRLNLTLFLNLDKNETSLSPAPIYKSEPLRLSEVTSRHILKVLDMTGGRIHGPNGAAKILHINPSTLRSRMEKLGIEKAKQNQRTIIGDVV